MKDDVMMLVYLLSLLWISESVVDASVELLSVDWRQSTRASVSAVLVNSCVVIAVDDSITVTILTIFLHVSLN